MKNDSVFYSLMSTAHFYVSLILGLRLFDVLIYPYFYVETGHAGALAATLPIYALNAMAFGTLVYVATRPFALLLEHLLDELFSAFNRGIERLNRQDRSD